MKVTIYGPNLPRELSDKGTLVAHLTGCPDTLRRPYTGLGPDSRGWDVDADTIEDIIGDVYGDFEEYPDEPQADPDAYGQYRHDIHIFPCIDLPEHKEDLSCKST